MMRDVMDINLQVDYLGRKYENPLFLCPTGVLQLAHPKADAGVAAAASRLKIPMIFSNQASRSMEETAEVMGNAPRFFQLYWSKSDELVTSFLECAKKCGCHAIVVTLDTTLLGWRIRELLYSYLPFLYADGIAQYTSDPVFNKIVEWEYIGASTPRPGRPSLKMIQALYKMAKNFPGSTRTNFRTQKPLKSIRKFLDVFMRPSLQWSDLTRLRQMTDLPIILKGIQLSMMQKNIGQWSECDHGF